MATRRRVGLHTSAKGYVRKRVSKATKVRRFNLVVRKHPKVLIALHKQSGKMGNKPMDRKRHALPPGKRLSVHGKEYWETRVNRSDLHKYL